MLPRWARYRPLKMAAPVVAKLGGTASCLSPQHMGLRGFLLTQTASRRGGPIPADEETNP
jgi:hypothetical protein